MASLLPGQQIITSSTGVQVSSYLWGSNVPPDYNSKNARNTAQIQALIKQAGFTLLRCAITANSSDSYIDQTAQACSNMGCAMLVILDFSKGIAWCQHLVQYLGSRCLLYEFRNEPDLGIASWSQYLSDWNSVIPVLRKLNPSAAFIGPTLGVYANVGSYLTPWLQGCVKSGVMPDGISFHNYPCTGTPDSATCSTKSDRLGVSATKLDAVVQQIVGHSLPLCLTEWHINANPSSEPYMSDAAFIAKWTKEAIDGMVAANVAMACQFDAGSGAASGKLDLVSTSNFQPGAMYGAMRERIAFYMGAGPVPTPVPTPTPTPVPTPASGFKAVKAGPFHVTGTLTAFNHNLGVVPDVVVPIIQTDAAASHTCSVDFSTMTDQTVRLMGDGEFDVYVLAMKLG
jgi:hypothetical protein